MGNKKGKILLIEDNQDHVELMTMALEDYQVDVCVDSNTCYDMLKDGIHDVILIDYSLPDTNGLELLERFKARGIKIPVIFITGQGDERIAAQAIKAGAKDYIVKSRETLNDLQQIVEQHIVEEDTDSNAEKSKFDLPKNHVELFEQIKKGCSMVADKIEYYINVVGEKTGVDLQKQIDQLTEHIEKAKAKLEELKSRIKK